MRDTSLGLQMRFWWDLAQILKSSWHEPARKRIAPRTREHKHSLPAGQCWAATNFLQYLVKEQLHSKQNEGSSTNGERRWGGDRKRWYSWGHPQSWRRLPKDDQGMGGVGKRRIMNRSFSSPSTHAKNIPQNCVFAMLPPSPWKSPSSSTPFYGSYHSHAIF